MAYLEAPPPSLSVIEVEAPVALPESNPDGLLAAAISTGVVRLLRKHTGRGPTKAKTTLSDDLAVVTLADCLTTAEKQLASNGHRDLVIRARTELQRGMRADAIALVEQLTQREVTAYLTDQQIDPDHGVIVFMLGPSVLQSA